MSEAKNKAQRRETYAMARDELRREAMGLPPTKPMFITASFLVALVFSALLGAMLVGMLQSEATLAAARGGGMGRVLGLVFFLMPIVLTLRYGFTRLKAHRRLRQLLRAEAELTRKLEDCDAPDAPEADQA